MKTTLALATTVAAAVAGAPGTRSPAGPVSGFGGAESVAIVHVGHIEVDLGPAGTAGLRQVRCAGVPAGTTTCFVGRG